MNFASKTGHGIFFGLIAAIFYGLIPTFTLPIRQVADGSNADAMSDMSILFYRFMFAAAIIAVIMIIRRQSFRITRGEAVTLIYLAFLSDGAAMFLLAGYDYLSSGIATTIHFMYPVATAVLMMMFYNEARRLSTISAVIMAVGGVGILSWPTDGGAFQIRGIALELISAVCFALYIIRVNRSRVAEMDFLKLTFYVVLFGALIFGGEAFRQESFQLITTSTQAIYLFAMALVCTVITNLALVLAVKCVGSTTAAVLGALEPLTAVILGVILFSEVVTWNVVVGICLIIPAVIIVIYTRNR